MQLVRVMLTRVVPWLGQRGRVSGAARRARRSKRAPAAGPQQLLWLAAAGSVAFLLWQIQRRTGPASGAAPAPAAERSAPEQQRDAALPVRTGATREARRAPSGGGLAAASERPELAASWVHRARLALRRGGADGLRRLGADMAHAGLEVEAGLLGNYALLLERSSSSRPRVLAEVARMLEAASVHRGAAPAAARKPLVPMPVVPVDGRRRATG